MEDINTALLFNNTMVMIAGGNNTHLDGLYEYDESSGSEVENGRVKSENTLNEFELTNDYDIHGTELFHNPDTYMEELISSDLSSDEDKFLESIRYGGGSNVNLINDELLSEEELVNTIQTYGNVKVVQVESNDQINSKKRKNMINHTNPKKGKRSDDDQMRTDNPDYQELMLSEEEKRLLVKEGISLPTHYPLTKLEERELKRIRRKIRNKISAQDSRKRKKEFLDKLQIRVNEVEEEKSVLHKRVRSLENLNSKLTAQVKRLQQALNSSHQSNESSKPTVVPAATTLLVLILSLALVVLPTSIDNSRDYPTTSNLTAKSDLLMNGLFPRSRAMVNEPVVSSDAFASYKYNAAPMHYTRWKHNYFDFNHTTHQFVKKNIFLSPFHTLDVE